MLIDVLLLLQVLFAYCTPTCPISCSLKTFQIGVHDPSGCARVLLMYGL